MIDDQSSEPRYGASHREFNARFADACNLGESTAGRRSDMLGSNDRAVVDRAVRAVHREDFVSPDQRGHAADDTPLPIGFSQTISQPSLVQEMTRQLALHARSRVLEIGTGSGYQTAILAEIAGKVFTIERIPELAVVARERLERLGYRNIEYRVGDGARGWPEVAPFDGIIVTAAPRSVPGALADQLAPNGRMLIPVGASLNDQVLVLLTKDAKGHVHERELFAVRFVPLISDRWRTL